MERNARAQYAASIRFFEWKLGRRKLFSALIWKKFQILYLLATLDELDALDACVVFVLSSRLASTSSVLVCPVPNLALKFACNI